MAIDIGPPQNVQNIHDTNLWLSSLYNWIISRESSDGVNFLQSGTGSVPRTVQSKLRDFVNVRDFGVVGDGSTDDTVALQAAIDAAVAAGGTKVIFPQTASGNYVISTKLTISGKVCLEGDGQYHTRIYCNNCDGIEIAAGVTGVKISDLEIAHAVRYTTSTNTHVGIKFLGSTGSRPMWDIISNVFIDGFGTGIQGDWLWSTNFQNIHMAYGHIGIYLTGLSVNNTFSNCKISVDGTSGSRGMLLGDGTTPSEGALITNCLLYGGEIGVEAIAFGQSCITNSAMDYSTEYGIQITNSVTNMCSGWQISNNYIATDGSGAIAGVSIFNDIDHAQNLGNRVIGNYIYSYDGNCNYGVVINGDYADNNSIIGNVVSNIDDVDIYVVEGVNNIIALNQCLSTAPSPANIYCTTKAIVLGNFVAVAEDLSNFDASTSQGVTVYRSGTASPSGAVTPYFVGEEYLDTNASKWYKSIGLANTNWVALN